MIRFRSITTLLGGLISISLATGQDLPPRDTAALETSSDAPLSQAISDSGVEAKLAAAQAGWDQGSQAPPSVKSPVSGSSLGGLLLQVFASISVLILAALAMIVLVQRARRKHASAAGTGAGMIDLLESRSVGAGRQVNLIRLHNRVVAVAYSGQTATVLSEFAGTDAAEIIAESGTGKTSIREFSATLDSLMDKFRAHPGDKPADQDRLR